jgi:prolipoprotein diacylglyceryltransferase
VLLYLDYYRAHTETILDASQGSLTLAGGVAGGVVTALLVAMILGAPVRRWLGVAIVPLLLALGLGKLAMVLGGAGQGLPSVGEWSTAYAGTGPWGSLAPQIPSDPSQVYEAVTTAGALFAVLVLALIGPLRRRPVTLFAAGVGLWALGRFAVAYTWRDPVLVGELNGDQLVTIGIAIVCGLAIVGSLGAAVRERRRRGAAGADATDSGGLGAAGAALDGDLEILPADEPHPVQATVAQGDAGSQASPAPSSFPSAGDAPAPPSIAPAPPSDVPVGTGTAEPPTER